MGARLHTASALMLLTTATAWADTDGVTKPFKATEHSSDHTASLQYEPLGRQPLDRHRFVAAASRVVDGLKHDYRQHAMANSHHEDLLLLPVVQLAEAASTAYLAQLDQHLWELQAAPEGQWNRQLDEFDQAWLAAQRGLDTLNLLTKA